jgi:hypothetical protein
MKKTLLSVAAVSMLATSSFAYDLLVTDTNKPNNYVINYYQKSDNNVVNTNAFKPNENGVGNALIYPIYYATSNGWSSTVRVINTSDKAVVAKVVLYSAANSKEIKDFNIYLSGHDEWVGKIEEVAYGDGQAIKISSTDSSVMTDCNNTAASKTNPFETYYTGPIAYGEMGYIQVIAMVEAKTAGAYHQNHTQLATDFLSYAASARDLKLANNAFLCRTLNDMQEGMFKPYYDTTNNVFKYPYLPYITISSDKFQAPEANVLTGDIRITNTQNKTDMVMPAVALNYNEDHKDAGLVYYLGETANLADAYLDITGSEPADATTSTNSVNNRANKYSVGSLISSIKNLGRNYTQAYVTYGDTSSPDNNKAYLTIPFKRAIVQSNDGTKALTDVTDNGNILFDLYGDYNNTYGAASNGVYKMGLDIYDDNENKWIPPLDTITFSPANVTTNTPFIDVPYEVTDLSAMNKYIADSGYKNGYVIVRGLGNDVLAQTGNTYVDYIPGILTQFKATEVEGQVVTNWIRNQGKK